jgi:hypothetical protein
MAAVEADPDPADPHRRITTMRTIRPSHRIAALAAALLALAAGAPAGAWTPISDVGNTGYFQGPDESYAKGAVCRYDSDFDLARIDIKPPQAHSYYDQTQRVGYRFIIERDTQQYDAVYETFYRSPFIYDTATLQTVTDYPVRTFSGFPATPSGNWRVRIVLKWVKPGFQEKPDGSIHGSIDAYKAVQGPNAHGSTGYCSESY